jgi:heme/copper-type cytochrome/quinol oxidase subunit 2
MLSMGLIGSSAVGCVACVRGSCNLLRWTRQRAERLSMVLIGDGVAVMVIVAEVAVVMVWVQIRVVRRERRHALSMPRPSQSKQ